MIYGHGDDTYLYQNQTITNFSSNCFAEADNTALISHLKRKMGELIAGYPHPEAQELKDVIAKRFATSPSRISVFNGATEAIYNIARDLEKKTSLIVGPTFSEYEAGATLYKHDIIHFNDRKAVLRGEKQTTSPEWIAELDEAIATLKESALIWICNPNNPDGQCFPKKQLMKLIQSNPDHNFIVDQSYAPFTAAEVLDINNPFKNVLIIHSLTKQYAIPGLRLGYVTGDEHLIQMLDRNRMPWSVNALAIEAGVFLLSEEKSFAPTAEMLRQEMDWLANALHATGTVECFESDTHYFLARLKRGDAARLKEQLALDYGLLIRNAENFAPHYKGYFRIAVKSASENRRLSDAFASLIDNNKLGV
ncbi:MAG: aminotransferase class I/II-fold pyridoxal phosphate-dependent enzyme [Bacteroidales bacterium]